MRLSTHYITVFTEALAKFISADETVELRLYGSRTDDTLQGGDIDLLIVTETEALATQLKAHKFALLGAIFTKIDEQKIDILIVSQEKLADNPFAEAALESSEVLYAFK